MKHHFILNPAAGKKNQTDLLQAKIHEACQALQADYTIYLTKCPRDAGVYAREILDRDQEEHRFYACGGDGTICELINGIPCEPRATFGIIPEGTGNDFCRNFSSNDLFHIIQNQIEGTPQKIDLIRYNDKYSINMLNIGFDCNVVVSAIEWKKKRLFPTKMAYIAGIASTFFKKLLTNMTVTLSDGKTFSRPLLLLAIANGGYCGGGFHSAPLASVQDGVLDVNIIERIPRLSFLRLVSSYKKGTHLDRPAGKKFITYIKTNSLTIDFAEPTKVCVDGEIEIWDHLEISVLPAAASFIVPKGSFVLHEEAMPSSMPLYLNQAKI